MAHANSAPGRWTQLDNKRRSFLNRCEVYAKLTLPKICPVEGYKQENQETTHDYQSVGAQAVNHLSNKIMLATFAPSRVFFRLDPSPEKAEQLAAAQVPQQDLQSQLAKAEREAVQALDQMAIRPKLYEGVKHLIITGNVMLCLEHKTIRVIGLKRYVVRRSLKGVVQEIMISDPVLFDELDPDVQEVIKRQRHYQPDHKVTLYRWIVRNPMTGDYEMTQWVDTYRLPEEFNGKWPEDQLPYRALTWDLADGADYGTGLVEDYKGDFAGLSLLSRSQIMGAVLASEFRWLVNPAGMTKPEDLERSENGAALPGQKDDVVLIQSGKSQDLAVAGAMATEYVNRIGRGFLLGSAMVRDAERVTAEEIRMQANELETSLGGAYSRLAVDFQLPLARWLLAMIGLGLHDSGFSPSIVTGLEALSRTGDLEDLKLWLADLAALATLPPDLQGRLKMDAIALALAAPRRVDAAQYLKSAEEIAQEQAQARQAEMETNAVNAGVQAGAKVAAEQGTNQ